MARDKTYDDSGIKDMVYDVANGIVARMLMIKTGAS
jgi:hypothetical protein